MGDRYGLRAVAGNLRSALSGVAHSGWRNLFRQASSIHYMTDYTTVSIPKDLAQRIDETIEGTSFSSTSDLVRFLLRSIVVQHQRQGELTEAEFAEIAEQLRELGYLN